MTTFFLLLTLMYTFLSYGNSLINFFAAIEVPTLLQQTFQKPRDSTNTHAPKHMFAGFDSFILFTVLLTGTHFSLIFIKLGFA